MPEWTADGYPLAQQVQSILAHMQEEKHLLKLCPCIMDSYQILAHLPTTDESQLFPFFKQETPGTRERLESH